MIKGVLLDLGGVAYVGEQVYPGAIDAIRRLRESDLSVRFVTNTTRKSRRAFLEKLAQLGLPVPQDELFMPALAARSYLTDHRLTAHPLVHPNLLEDFAALPSGDRDAVVIGDAGAGFTYEALNAAFRKVVNGAEFVALARNRYFRDDDGELSLDAGPFVAAIEYATKREAIVLGKPSPDFFRTALTSLGCEPHEASMVGDDVEADIGGAMAVGIRGLLVRTGKYVAGAEKLVESSPTAVVDDLEGAVEWVLSRTT